MYSLLLELLLELAKILTVGFSCNCEHSR